MAMAGQGFRVALARPQWPWLYAPPPQKKILEMSIESGGSSGGTGSGGRSGGAGSGGRSVGTGT